MLLLYCLSTLNKCLYLINIRHKYCACINKLITNRLNGWYGYIEMYSLPITFKSR